MSVSHVMTIPIVQTSLVIYCLFNVPTVLRNTMVVVQINAVLFGIAPGSTGRACREKMEFNGTKFGKGRYKVHRQNEALDTE